MIRRSVLLALVLVLAVIVAASAFGRSTATRSQALVGTVGPGYTINLTIGGQKVVRLKAGTYKLTIHDKAAIHAWSLDGPHGYAKDFTKVPFVGSKTFTVKLAAGKYKYYCPPHESMMFGHFTVVA
jgi:plastocyanin